MHVPCLLLIKIDNQVLDCRLDSTKGVLMQWVSLASARGVMKEGFVASIQVLGRIERYSSRSRQAL